MDKRIIVINGTGGSGKDTFVEYVSNYCNVCNFSSIDKVKEIAKIIGWNGEKDEKSRKFLSDLKRITTDYNDMPFKSVESAILDFYNTKDDVMFVHIREPEEIKKVVDRFGAKTLLIKREGLDNILSNDSDANVDKYNYDYEIVNISLDGLRSSAENFFNNVIKKKVN